LQGVLAEGGGDVADRLRSRLIGSVSYGGKELRSGTQADAACIFAERHVPHPMQTILDAPVPTPPFQQGQGTRLVAWHTRDGIVDFDLLFTVAMRGPLNAANPTGRGPI
jgi:hypothetical protein